jgi:DNA-binding MarR family transcriptional regulator
MATTPPTLLRDVARLHVQAQRALLACESASVTQCTILTELGRSGPVTLGALARRLRLDKGWTSRAVDQLLAEGLVSKTGGDDRRTFTIALTRSGSVRVRRLEATLNGQVARVIARIPRAHRTGVARALELLHTAYLSELNAQAAAPEAEAVA